MRAATSEERTVLTTSPQQMQQARAFVESHVERPERVSLPQPDGDVAAPLPKELSRIITDVVRVLARGGTVTIGALPEDVTTTVAARMLGVSRPTLMKMIARGDIPAHKVGSHSRLRSEDVLAARATRRQRQRDAFAQLRELEDDV